VLKGVEVEPQPLLLPGVQEAGALPELEEVVEEAVAERKY
jgi:hypothetical protein